MTSFFEIKRRITGEQWGKMHEIIHKLRRWKALEAVLLKEGEWTRGEYEEARLVDETLTDFFFETRLALDGDIAASICHRTFVLHLAERRNLIKSMEG